MADTITFGGALTVNRLGFGAMRIMGSDDPVALVRRVVEAGVDFIDTADMYGMGRSETLIADALHPYPDGLVIATKAGFDGEGPMVNGSRPPKGRPEDLRAACDGSLARLRVDRIDLYQLHAPDPSVAYEDQIGALVELREAGKIAHIGISNVGRKHIAQATAVSPIVSVQNRYSPLDRSSERVLEMCEEQGIAFLPWGPIQIGGQEVVAAVAARHGVTPQAVSLAWLLARSPVMLPIPGTSKIEHLEENLAARDLRLTDQDLAELGALAPA